MKSKPILAIDIDDTVTASTEAWRKHANRRAGIDLGPEQYQVRDGYWGYYDRVWQRNGVSHLVTFDEIDAELAASQAEIVVLDKAKEAIGQLSEKYQILFVTSRNLIQKPATLLWFKQHFPTQKYKIYFTQKADKPKSGSKGEPKGQLCQRLGAQILIDDHIEHCESAKSFGLEAILFGDYGWHTHKPDGIVNCQDWPAIMEYLDGR